MKTISNLKKETHKIWAEVVKLTFSGKCFLCSHRNPPIGSYPLDAHHLIKRGELSTRFHPLNGVPLCRIHHSMVEDNLIDLMPYIEKYLPNHFAFVSNHVVQIVQFPRSHIEEWNKILKETKKELTK